MTREEEIERNHMMDLFDEPYAKLVVLHQESCSTDETYPGWDPSLGCCAADVILKAKRAQQRETRRAHKAARRTRWTNGFVRGAEVTQTFCAISLPFLCALMIFSGTVSLLDGNVSDGMTDLTVAAFGIWVSVATYIRHRAARRG